MTGKPVESSTNSTRSRNPSVQSGVSVMSPAGRQLPRGPVMGQASTPVQGQLMHNQRFAHPGISNFGTPTAGIYVRTQDPSRHISQAVDGPQSAPAVSQSGAERGHDLLRAAVHGRLLAHPYRRPSDKAIGEPRRSLPGQHESGMVDAAASLASLGSNQPHRSSIQSAGQGSTTSQQSPAEDWSRQYRGFSISSQSTSSSFQDPASKRSSVASFAANSARSSVDFSINQMTLSKSQQPLFSGSNYGTTGYVSSQAMGYQSSPLSNTGSEMSSNTLAPLLESNQTSTQSQRLQSQQQLPQSQQLQSQQQLLQSQQLQSQQQLLQSQQFQSQQQLLQSQQLQSQQETKQETHPEDQRRASTFQDRSTLLPRGLSLTLSHPLQSVINKVKEDSGMKQQDGGQGKSGGSGNLMRSPVERLYDRLTPQTARAESPRISGSNTSIPPTKLRDSIESYPSPSIGSNEIQSAAPVESSKLGKMGGLGQQKSELNTERDPNSFAGTDEEEAADTDTSTQAPVARQQGRIDFILND
jgi:hypothetical protein